MTNGRNVFDQPIKNDLKPYHNIRKIATGQGDDYTIISEEAKETVLDLSKGTVKVLRFYFNIILI